MHFRFQAFCDAARKYREQYPSQREGQAHMNVLGQWEPELYVAITGTDIDPFYVDSKMGDFLSYVLEHLPEYSSACAHTENSPHKCAACQNGKLG